MPVRVVPLRPPAMEVSEIKTAKPVRGKPQWFRMAKNAIYLKGKGGQLASMNPRTNLAAGGDTVINVTNECDINYWFFFCHFN